MTPAQIATAISERFADRLLEVFIADKHPRVPVVAEHWRALAEFLGHDSALSLDWLANLSALDYVADDKVCVVYDLWSLPGIRTCGEFCWLRIGKDIRFARITFSPGSTRGFRQALNRIGSRMARISLTFRGLET